MSRQHKKVIGFDSWTSGAQHYSRLLPALETESIEITLVHLGSWGNQPGRPPEEKIGNLLVRDISYYGGDDFEKVLEIERPDAVILLSTETFAHRAFIRYCKQRSIPTLFLYHGLVNVQVTDDKDGSYVVNRSAHLEYVLSKAHKLIRHTFPGYVKSLLQTKASYSDWRRFIFDVFRMARGEPSLVAADDARTAACAVYTSADVEHAMRVYGFKKEEVFVVGNPDLLQFGLCSNLLGSWRHHQAQGNQAVMYIDAGLATVGLMFSGIADFCDHLIITSKLLALQNFRLRLKLKPHPVEVFESIKRGIEGSEIELVSNDNFLPRLKECAACITQTSTLALIPALLGMPLLLANYDQLSSLKFGRVYTSYPRSYFFRAISELSGILSNDRQQSNTNQINDWIAFNVGPLPPEQMPSRVVDILTGLIAANQLEESM